MTDRRKPRLLDFLKEDESWQKRRPLKGTNRPRPASPAPAQPKEITFRKLSEELDFDRYLLSKGKK